MNRPPQYAGFLRRLAATLLDSILFIALTSLLLYLLYGGDYFSEPQQAFSFYGTGDFLLNQILPLLAAVFFWTRYRGTPGKRLLNCLVVDANTLQAISLRQAVLRYFAYIVSILPLGLGFLWIIWHKRKQGWHDLIAHTVVLYAPKDEADKSMRELLDEMK